MLAGVLFLFGGVMSIKNTDIFGRKVFFIAPDTSIIHLSFMEDFCALGYESHILGRSDGSLEKNVEIITSHFPDAVLFVNVDAAAPGGNWLQFVRQIRQQNMDMIVGVIFSAFSRDRVRQVENEFGNAVSPLAGCVGLTPGDGDANFKTLVTTLEKVGAKGRRNYIRAVCNETSGVSFNVEGKPFHARIDDVNVAHISCILDASSDIHGMKIYEKVRGAHVSVNGLEFYTDIILIMKRDKAGVSTAVFMFIKAPDDEPGIESELEAPLNKKIYEITSREFAELLRK